MIWLRIGIIESHFKYDLKYQGRIGHGISSYIHYEHSDQNGLINFVISFPSGLEFFDIFHNAFQSGWLVSLIIKTVLTNRLIGIDVSVSDY